MFNLAWLAATGAKPVVDTTLPTLGSPVQALDASNAATLFTDTAGVVPVTDGAVVASANDAFGGAYRWEQASASLQPTWVANAQNGRGGLRFNGSRYLALNAPAPVGAVFQSRSFTLIVAYRRVAGTTWGGVFSAGSGTGGAGNAGYDLVGIETGRPPNSWPVLYRNSGSAQSAAPLTSPSYADGQLWKLVARCDAANGLELRAKNSVSTYVGTGALPGSADNYPWDAAFLGGDLAWQGQSPPLYLLDGWIFEFRFWNTRASDAQAAQLMAYLDTKWGA